ncbi:MerR family transcriptional regulator [Streptomyces sp. ID01-9D]|uniref:MerR family transcriptional regulator n=1 Tax=Streptomyces sp. ID01-9D TaxID=3028659 RepID=UPI0029C596D0|nr:MerR family transcriptional regulator [Streptomyces sp. ID01-9D]MDX5577439.1 MerR family transcriptional regulator [Streptomyces sp. ID01-9D]
METEQEISFIDGGVMRTAEVANNLNVVESTIRKYSKCLEKQGYTFIKEPSNNNGRLYSKQDQEVLQEIKTLTDNKRMSIELAVSLVVSRRGGKNQSSQHEAPRAPMLTDEERAEKFLERMHRNFMQENEKTKQEMKIYFEKNMRDVVENVMEDVVKSAIEKEKQRHKEELRLLREEIVNDVTKVIQKDRKKNWFQRLFGN